MKNEPTKVELITASDVEIKEDDTKAIKDYRKNINMASSTKGEECLFKKYIKNAYLSLEIFIEKGGEEHSNPAYALALNMATTFMLEDEYEAARKMYKVAIEHYSKTKQEEWKAKSNLGVCELKAQNYKEAEILFKEAFEKNPDEATLLNLTLALHNLNKKDQVEKILNNLPKLIDLNKKESLFLFHLKHDKDCEPLKTYRSYQQTVAPYLNEK